MENDGFLEFKWKGDQFLIFRSCSICIATSSGLPSKWTTEVDGGRKTPTAGGPATWSWQKWIRLDITRRKH